MPDNSTRKFSDYNLAAPFGRYQSGSEPGASNEVLVGREEQRAYFIELLLRMGRRGAYLVTGRRGVGKTSFVNYCLAEYKEEVFERFLRSSVGRVVFWDHFGVLLLGFGIIFILLMISELLEIIALSTGWGKGNSPDILFGLVILPLALICIYPLLYAREILRKIFTPAHQAEGRSHLQDILATLYTGILAYLAFKAPPFGSPAVSMSRVLVAISVIYLWVQSTSYKSKQKVCSGSAIRLWPLLLIFGWVVAAPEFLLPDQEFYGNIFWGSFLFGTGILLRGLHLYWMRMHLECSPEGYEKGKNPISFAAALWYLVSGLLLIAVAWYCLLKRHPGTPTLLASTVVLGVTLLPFVALHHQGFSKSDAKNQQSQPSFRPRPDLILSAKAFLCIIVTLQLIHPIFDKWTPEQSSSHASGSPSALRPATSLFRISSLSSKEASRRKNAEVLDKQIATIEQKLDLRRQITLDPKRLDPEAQKVVGELEAEIHRQKGMIEEAEAARQAAKLFQQRSNSAVFYGRTEELSWVMGLFLCLALLFFIEYEWVLRPFVREREDGARALPSGWQDQLIDDRHDRHEFRRLAHLTLPWMVYGQWLPVLTVAVNLGFEKLDHRRVVHAMLAGLRDQYHRTFTAWNSGLANLGRILAFLLLMMLVTLAGDRWFAMPDIEGSESTTLSAASYKQICGLFEGRQRGPGAANWICKLPWGDTTFHILYYNLLQTKGLDLYPDRDRHLLFYVFPYQDRAWPPEGQPSLIEKGIHFRIYHILLFIFFFLLGRWLLHRLPIFPYQEILNRIDDTMDNLSSRTSVTSTSGRWKPAQWLQGFFMDERVRQTEQDPVDPRTVEFVFLQILRDIQGIAIQLPGGRNQLVSIPTPEITFVLDELDKIGTRVDPDEGGSSGGAQQIEILNAERRRSMELHKLLADMKNLLSSAPARFIFVGGRNLHDEWLADQTARQPLLTNIFTAEIYLPSLLTDYDLAGGKYLDSRVRSYFENQVHRGRQLFKHSQEKHWLPFLALPLDRPTRESYLHKTPSEVVLTVLGTDDGAFLASPPGEELIRDFYQFLTYRSMGNPKKLKELISTFVRPADRILSDRVRWKPAEKPGEEGFRDCDHVLFFGDTERFRIQLLARVYRHLVSNFEQSLVRRDDKLAASVLYLTDFLFKFHRRAFSWSNLERVDELVHIHRAPDLREILEAIVTQWSERFLHQIRNGMYDFRFRSDIAREIAYISRQSAEEMAAFNFTLDESQTLKSAYEVNISRLKEGNGKELQDLVAGLGELYEFDQEYETARFYYRRAISLLDEELEEVIGGSVMSETSSRIEIIGGAPGGQESARLYMTWGVARLRLMLQIGMTFEHSRNLERAEMEYQNARTLAQSLLISMLDNDGRRKAAQLGVRQAEGAPGDDRLHALKHLNILFQPMFAEIWVAEKLAGGVDTSTSLAEKELWTLRNLLPFVRKPAHDISERNVDTEDSNFALIATEVYNKTGDLYFFKGRQLRNLRDFNGIDDWLNNATSSGCEGYLLAAHYHYAVGLHELRRFIIHRRNSSEQNWSLPASGTARITIATEGWPDFVFRAVGGAFNDLAEALLGRVSLIQLLKELGAQDSSYLCKRCLADKVMKLVEGCTHWLEGNETEIPPILARKQPDTNDKPEKLENWLGVWRKDWNEDQRLLLNFEAESTDLDTFLASLSFSLAGARYLYAGGYIEDAAREFLKVCETITHYLWWGLIVRKVLRIKGKDAPAANGWAYLFSIALYALDESTELFLRSRRSEYFDKKESGKRLPLLGQTIPVFAMTLSCSLELALECWGPGELKASIQSELRNLREKWRTHESHCATATNILENSLKIHSYPMLNRLHMLKLLIDYRAVKGEIDDTVIKWAEELLEMEAGLNAPLHFTPLHIGTTCALVRILNGQDRTAHLGYEGEKALLSSQEMYTMRRAFYENISDLYYLYDDFNDRQLHFNHAIQMAGTELASLLQVILPLSSSPVRGSEVRFPDQPISTKKRRR